MVKSNFERDMGTLRGYLKSLKCEIDPYKAIIIVERYILEYGMSITKKTVKILTSGLSTEDKMEVLMDVMQTEKPPNQLIINTKKYAGFKSGFKS